MRKHKLQLHKLKLYKVSTLLLSAVLLFPTALLTTGCGIGNAGNTGNTGGGSSSGTGTISSTENTANTETGLATGRYVEEALGVPEDLGRPVGPVVLNDGNLLIYDYNNGPYLSEDEGKTWIEQYENWMDRVEPGYYMNCAVSGDGGLFLEYQTYPEAGGDSAGEGGEVAAEETVEKTTEEASGSEVFSNDINLKYVLVSPEGEVKPLALPFDGNAYEFLSNCWFTPDGRLLVSQGGMVFEADQETGQTKLLFEAEEDIELACFSQKMMAGFGKTGVYWYDLESDMLLEQDSAQQNTALDQFLSNLTESGEDSIYYTSGNYQFLACLGEDETLYIGCEKGLYSYQRDSDTMTLLLDGPLSTLGDPSEPRIGMTAVGTASGEQTGNDQANGKQELLILFGSALSRLSYDADMPTAPENELVVYSLKRNAVLQQAVSIYQKQHPETAVRYEMGMTSENGQTREDAIKALNTEMMAGEGPDVLVLDGLPLESYMEKGMLTDLTGLYKEASGQEAFYENIALSLQQEEKLYAIPASFRIPLLFGDSSTLKGMTDLGSLAEAVEELRKQKPEGSILSAYVPEVLLAMMAPSCASAWRAEDGSVNEATVKEFLIQAKRIYEAESAGITETDREEYLNTRKSKDGTIEDFLTTATDISWSIMDVVGREKALIMGKTAAVNLDYTNLISVIRQQPDFDFLPAVGQGDAAFLAETIVGISAKAKEIPLAEDFVKTLLSDQVLSKNGDAYPVNRKSLSGSFERAQGEEGEEDTAFGSIMVVKEDGSGQTLDIYWPDEKEQEKLENMIASLTVPYIPGNLLEETVLNTGKEVLEGGLTVEEGVKQIQEKVKLYLAEQA